MNRGRLVATLLLAASLAGCSAGRITQPKDIKPTPVSVTVTGASNPSGASAFLFTVGANGDTTVVKTGLTTPFRVAGLHVKNVYGWFWLEDEGAHYQPLLVSGVPNDSGEVALSANLVQIVPGSPAPTATLRLSADHVSVGGTVTVHIEGTGGSFGLLLPLSVATPGGNVSRDYPYTPTQAGDVTLSYLVVGPGGSAVATAVLHVTAATQTVTVTGATNPSGAQALLFTIVNGDTIVVKKNLTTPFTVSGLQVSNVYGVFWKDGYQAAIRSGVPNGSGQVALSADLVPIVSGTLPPTAAIRLTPTTTTVGNNVKVSVEGHGGDFGIIFPLDIPTSGGNYTGDYTYYADHAGDITFYYLVVGKGGSAVASATLHVDNEGPSLPGSYSVDFNGTLCSGGPKTLTKTFTLEGAVDSLFTQVTASYPDNEDQYQRRFAVAFHKAGDPVDAAHLRFAKIKGTPAGSCPVVPDPDPHHRVTGTKFVNVVAPALEAGNWEIIAIHAVRTDLVPCGSYTNDGKGNQITVGLTTMIPFYHGVTLASN